MTIPPADAAWDAFVAAHPSGWFWHRRDWIEWETIFGQGEDLSFSIPGPDGQITGICPLVLKRGGFFDRHHPLAIPLGLSSLDVELMVLKVNVRAAEIQAPTVAFRGSPLSAPVDLSPFIFNGYEDISWPSRVIDLTRPEVELWREVRTSFHSLVNGARRRVKVEEGPALIGAYAQLNDETVGHVFPRPRRTYELQAKWLVEGQGLLVGALSPAGQWLAFVYAIVYKQKAYYASGPSAEPSVSHLLQWETILRLKAIGVTAYETGWMARPWDSEKEGQIAFFKAGFGGREHTVQAVERMVEKERQE